MPAETTHPAPEEPACCSAPTLSDAAPLLAASSPGGLAPHYRVQRFVSGDEVRPWQLHATCKLRIDAEQAAADLRASGQAARIINVRTLPTAS
ncbi:hypothetical protein Psta_0019 [Pirellula staleyi DSM 6068]|uniref:SPOR domain-containing protein n=1 Tax=Pirellula staleyi (strain ATCC 27377 / DSM 6068 / ICPB 4128) TaxID=530564 RepID=D2QZF8_PIRSD|nr:hypothetical protein [Pirellula staleyi]ADB14716.1 hypothetical protein Psta_0019 [Pirellula staleyi DSM 6068]